MATTFTIIAICVAIVAAVFVGKHLSLWLQGYVSGVRVGLLQIIFMTLRKVDARTIVGCQVLLVQAGLDPIPTRSLEAHVLAGGNLNRLVTALIASHRARVPLSWDTAAAIQLAGRDILEAVQTSVTPKVIFCPDPERGRGDALDGVAMDGIQLKVRICVTVWTNVEQLIGGATEPTVIARVGEAIVSAIGSCHTYKDALADPGVITRRAIASGLDADTAFRIVSIDIADIDVGRNIGARLQIEQAEADMRVARANAEKRRAMAIATEQEMLAKTRENEATVVQALALIPAAVADAYRAGQLRVPSNGSEEGSQSFSFRLRSRQESRPIGYPSKFRV